MKKADWHLVEEWAAQYPIGTEVEVKTRVWAKGVVTRHDRMKMTIWLVVKIEGFGVLHFSYGMRQAVRKVSSPG